MTDTTVQVLDPAAGWTAVGGANPTAITVKSNMKIQSASMRLLVSSGGAPAATAIGNRLNAGDAMSFASVTGQLYGLAEGQPHEIAVTA